MPGLTVLGLGLAALLGLGTGAHLCLSQQLKMPGKYILGGLFPLGLAEEDSLRDRAQPRGIVCPRFSALGLFLAMALKMAVEEINNGSALLPGLRLGYDLFDTCSDPMATMKPSLMFLAKEGSRDIAAYCDYTQYQPRVLAVIGPHSSELALITGKFFSFFLVPQVGLPSPSAPPRTRSAVPTGGAAVPAGQLWRQHGAAEQPGGVPLLLPHGAQRPRAAAGHRGAAAGVRLELGGGRGQRRRVRAAGAEHLLGPGQRQEHLHRARGPGAAVPGGQPAADPDDGPAAPGQPEQRERGGAVRLGPRRAGPLPPQHPLQPPAQGVGGQRGLADLGAGHDAARHGPDGHRAWLPAAGPPAARLPAVRGEPPGPGRRPGLLRHTGRGAAGPGGARGQPALPAVQRRRAAQPVGLAAAEPVGRPAAPPDLRHLRRRVQRGPGPAQHPGLRRRRLPRAGARATLAAPEEHEQPELPRRGPGLALRRLGQRGHGVRPEAVGVARPEARVPHRGLLRRASPAAAPTHVLAHGGQGARVAVFPAVQGGPGAPGEGLPLVLLRLRGLQGRQLPAEPRRHHLHPVRPGPVVSGAEHPLLPPQAAVPGVGGAGRAAAAAAAGPHAGPHAGHPGALHPRPAQPAGAGLGRAAGLLRPGLPGPGLPERPPVPRPAPPRQLPGPAAAGPPAAHGLPQHAAPAGSGGPRGVGAAAELGGPAARLPAGTPGLAGRAAGPAAGGGRVLLVPGGLPARGDQGLAGAAHRGAGALPRAVLAQLRPGARHQRRPGFPLLPGHLPRAEPARPLQPGPRPHLRHAGLLHHLGLLRAHPGQCAPGPPAHRADGRHPPLCSGHPGCLLPAQVLPAPAAATAQHRRVLPGRRPQRRERWRRGWGGGPGIPRVTTPRNPHPAAAP
ncbi:taste receptor type 1 member 3 isoform X1 [Oryctolagus cuniculus]|uniref:taste receptor type 1 member 3 isoform X1 n=1 Tax=Oryctolagus cuniculus TaxID=9986 RepID=UPI00222ECE8E|nr:taste receptor type 1 member 3 isoform X1 [Oryctolagus cuniculus]